MIEATALAVLSLLSGLVAIFSLSSVASVPSRGVLRGDGSLRSVCRDGHHGIVPVVLVSRRAAMSDLPGLARARVASMRDVGVVDSTARAKRRSPPAACGARGVGAIDCDRRVPGRASIGRQGDGLVHGAVAGAGALRSRWPWCMVR